MKAELSRLPTAARATVTQGESAGALAARLQDLLQAWLSRRSMRTREEYGKRFADFADFIGIEDQDEAARLFLAFSPGEANHKALEYKNHLMGNGLKANTVNARLSALRSLVSLARTLGLVTWSLAIPGEKARNFRDTRGPGEEGVRRMLRAIQEDKPKAVRDRALIRLTFDLALRRSEVCSLDLEDLDLAAGKVSVQGKGQGGEKDALTLPEPTKRALAAWLEARGDLPGPLFTSRDRARKGSGRLSEEGLRRLVARYGEISGVGRVRPHGIRHAAITRALDVIGDVRKVARFSRHADVRTVMAYDDNRQDMAGEVAAAVAAGV